MALSSQLRHVTFPRGRRLPPIDLTPPGRRFDTPERELSIEQSAFLGWLFGQAGLDHRSYRPETLIRRLPACLRFLRAASLTQARLILESAPARIGGAIDVMLVGVTSFFRDPDLFEWLERNGLEMRRETGFGLYVLSIGCSDGAELVSVAMMLAERGRLEDAYLLGTDCRSQAIERARLGVYDPMAMRSVSPDRCERFFENQGSQWRVQPEIRSALRWKASDVLHGLEPGAWDLILFRNTAMYFRPRILLSLWTRIEAALRPGGLLVLGRAERPVGVNRLAPVRRSVFCKVRG